MSQNKKTVYTKQVLIECLDEWDKLDSWTKNNKDSLFLLCYLLKDNYMPNIAGCKCVITIQIKVYNLYKKD